MCFGGGLNERNENKTKSVEDEKMVLRFTSFFPSRFIIGGSESMVKQSSHIYLTLLRCLGGAKSSFDFRRLSLRIIRAAANAMMKVLFLLLLWSRLNGFRFG
jgi:hypothetical protein